MQLTDPIAAAGKQFLLRPDVTFLNHGSFGARPQPVFDTYQHWQRELEAQPVEFLGRRLPALLREARAPLAAYLGAQPDDLVFVPNTTHGMNIIARSLKLGPGDEILCTDHEYGAVERTWRFMTLHNGATLRIQPISLPLTTPERFIEELWQSVTPQTRVLVVSHITSPTALTFPVEHIIRRAHADGMLVAIDGAHAPGQIPLNLDDLDADFYVGNLHKWLCAPVGAAFLHARHDRQAMLEPLVVSWGWQARVPGVSDFQDYFEWLGTDDPAAFLSVPAAIAFQAQHDWPTVQAACHQLADQAEQAINALTGLVPISPEENFAQMRAIPLPPCDAAALKTRLYDEFRIEIPITEWNGRQFVRVSIQAYNSPADVAKLVDAIGNIFG